MLQKNNCRLNILRLPSYERHFFGHKTLDDTLTNSIYLWEFSYQIKNTKREIYLFIPCESNRPVGKIYRRPSAAVDMINYFSK